MPQIIIPVISKAIAGAFFTGTLFTVANYAIQAGLYYIVGRFLYRAAAPDIPQFEIPLHSRKQYLEEPNAPQTLVYGRCYTTPTIVAKFSSDRMLNLLAIIAPHPVSQEVKDILVNDQPFFTEDELDQLNERVGTHPHRGIDISPSTASDGVSELRKEVNDRARDSGQVIMTIARDFTAPNPGNFASATAYIGQGAGVERPQFGNGGRGQSPQALNMRCSGLSWVYIQVPRAPTDRTKAAVWPAVPTLQFEVERENSSLLLPAGINGDDYRRGNSALVAYDYMKRYTDYANPVCGYDRIDIDSFRAAATFCDDRDRRLTCNGTIRLSTAPADVLDQLGLASNVGAFPEHAGIRYFAPGAPSSVAQHFTDDDIVKDTFVYSLLSPVESRVSTYLARYVDGDALEQTSGAHYETDATTASQEIQLDLVQGRHQANEVARILLSRIWNGATLSFEIHDATTTLRPYDKILVEGVGPLNLAETFRVLSLERNESGRISIQCQFEERDLFALRKFDDDAYVPPSRLPTYIPEGSTDTFRITINGYSNRLLTRSAGEADTSFISYR